MSIVCRPEPSLTFSVEFGGGGGYVAGSPFGGSANGSPGSARVRAVLLAANRALISLRKQYHTLFAQ